MKTERWWTSLALVLAMLFMIVSWIMFNSCSAERRITKIAARHPGAIINPCNIFLPPLISHDSVHYEYIQGEPVVTYDTAIVHDVATNTVYKTVTVRTVIHDTTVKEHDRTVVDQKPLALQEQKTAQAVKTRDAAIVDRARITNGRNSWRLIAILLMAYSAIRIVLRMWLKINLP